MPTVTSESPLTSSHGRPGRVSSRQPPGEQQGDLQDVGEAAGLGAPANFRRHFIQATGVTPSSYRRTFNTGNTGNARPGNSE
jgi:AraC-like DNA-binding protein